MNHFQRKFTGNLAKSFIVTFIATSLAIGVKQLSVHSQGNLQETILPGVAPSVLTAIREAPYSETFRIDTPKAGVAFGIKDRDYKASNDEISVLSLWADAPEIELLQVALRYCLPEQKLALSNAYLVEIQLSLKDELLVTIDQPAVSTRAALYEVAPARYVPNDYVYAYNAYRDSFWNPYSYITSYRTSTYVPAVNCSLGGSRFDLNPVKDAIATLPNQTLNMRLVFSNGMTADWRLGKGTVAALKELPTIQNQ